MTDAAQNDKSQLEPVRATRKPRKQAKAKPAPKKRPAAAPTKARAIVKAIPTALSLGERIEKIVMEGDLAGLSVDERLQYVKAMCHGLGIDWRTRPFAYIQLNGKIVLYALRNCTDQLRRVHGISVIDSVRTNEGGLCVITVKVQDRTGRTDTGTGAWPLEGKKGEDAVNAILKAETKAKRRATLSIAGLGILDASELDTVDYDEVSPSGRVVEVTPAVNPAEQKYLEREKEQLGMLTEPQREVVQRRMAEAEAKKNPVSQPAMPAPAAKEASAAKPAVVPESAAGSAPQVSPRSSAKGASSAAEPGNSAATAPYDGLTFSLRPDGDWEVEGLVSVKRGVRDLLLPFYDKPKDKIICSNTEAGKLMHQLEVRGVKARMIGDGDD